MRLVDRVSRIVTFMRAGYPTVMPATGYVPLAALLPRRVCDDEITAITGEFMMRRGTPISTTDVGVAISRITDEMPSPDDIERVKRRLDAIGCICR
jgi:NADPH-dependent 2,4-dienoyl-CoA reductase/sulfur reductase-like enzyme